MIVRGEDAPSLGGDGVRGRGLACWWALCVRRVGVDAIESVGLVPRLGLGSTT